MKRNIKLVAFELFAQGQTYGEIGKALGVSRQRVQQIVRPPKFIYDAVKQRAKGKCEKCGIAVTSGHVHHRNHEGQESDFNNLDNLEYLCRTCHRAAHTRIPPGGTQLKAIRFRPDQKRELQRLVSLDKEMTISSLIRRAVDQFIEREKGKK